MSCTERLIATNLLPLEFRREITDLMLLYKSKTSFQWTLITFYARTSLVLDLVIIMKIINISS
jgi:hypothetical protein